MVPDGHRIGTTLARGFRGETGVRWPLERASEIFELRYGRALVESTRRPGLIPVYGTNGQCGFHDSPLFRGPGVVLGRKGQGPLGVEWVEGDYWVIDTAYSLSLRRPDIDLKYSFYLIKFVGLNHLKDGTSNPSLSRDTFGAQLFPIPEIDAQRAIAHILATLDDKIELNRRTNETLETLARALFKSWFVDFDPVRAKAEGRLPFGMDEATAALFPSEFEESELGVIPKGWRVATLDSTVELLSGGTPKRSEPSYWGGEIPWFSIRDIPSNSDVFVTSTTESISQAGVENCSAKVLPAGVSLITARGTVGKVAILGMPMAINQSCYGVQGVEGFPPYFIYFLIKSVMDEIRQKSHGSVFDTITRDTFKGVVLPCPPTEIAQRYEIHVTALLHQIRANVEQAASLGEFRDTLLPRLLSGELSVERAIDLSEAVPC